MRDEDRNPATTEEPEPTGDGVEVWPHVWRRAEPTARGRIYRDDEQIVVDDMRAREALGRERYGTPLRAHNGRDALTDAYQEALDLCAYLGQVEIENGRTGLPSETWLLTEAISLARSIRVMIIRRGAR